MKNENQPILEIFLKRNKNTQKKPGDKRKSNNGIFTQ